jgi:DNA-binding transcriptional ArsR family regulator
VFLLLLRSRDREWTVSEVASAVGMPPPSAGMRLFLLASAGLLSASSESEARYQYVGGPELDLLADMLAAADSGARAQLAAMVSGSLPTDPARQFADAFRLRKP